MSTRRLLAALAVLSTALGACGDADGTGDAGAPTTAAPAAGATVATTAADTDPGEGDAPTPELLQFTAPLVGGGSFEAATVAGTPTVFWFWAPT